MLKFRPCVRFLTDCTTLGPTIMQQNYSYLTNRQEIIPFLDDIQKYADLEKNAFGFLPPNAYEKGSHSERIIVAVTATNQEYVGHIFFGGVFPNGRVFQTLVRKKFRKTGVAQALLKQLTLVLEGRGYTSLSAKVATDLTKANQFYSGMGFETIRTVDGGKTTGRKINLRLKQLGNPTLFSWQNETATSKSLNLPTVTSTRSPVYLIDLNVIFDAVRKRSRTKHSKALFSAGFQNLIRVAVSEELIGELERSSTPSRADPVLEMAKNFWVLAKPAHKDINQITKELAPIIFPDRYRDKKINTQDRSDLVHLATAILRGVSGFVTSEKKILAAGDYLRKLHSIDVISPYEIAELIEDDNSEPDGPIIIGDMTCTTYSNSDAPDVLSAIKMLSVKPGDLPRSDTLKDEEVRHLTIRSSTNSYVAYTWWTVCNGPLPKNQAYLNVKDNAPNADVLVDFICNKITRECTRRSISLLQLKCNTEIRVIFDAIHQCGFRPNSLTSSDKTTFQKICLGKPLHPENWQKTRLNIQTLTDGIKLPEKMPKISHLQDSVTLTDRSAEKMSITLADLEQLFSPTLYASDNMDGVILPILRSYSDELFNTHEQLSLLNTSEAILRNARVYFSSPSTRNALKVGRIIFFYESGKEKGGRKAIVAAARVKEANVMLVDSLGEDLLRRGVIDASVLANTAVSGRQLVTFFENIIPFQKNISYNRLNELGCNDGSNFVTAKRISPIHVQNIIKEGLLDG